MHLCFKHVTSDHSKQLRPCLYVVQNSIPIQNSYWEISCNWNFIYLFCQERKPIKSKLKSKTFSPNLTRKFWNKIFCLLRVLLDEHNVSKFKNKIVVNKKDSRDDIQELYKNDSRKADFQNFHFGVNHGGISGKY